MPNENTGAVDGGQPKGGFTRMSAAEALKDLPEEPAGEDPSEGAEQSKTTDESGNAGVNDDEGAGETGDDGKKGSEGESEDDPEDEDSEEDENEEEGGEAVVIPESLQPIVNTLKESNPEQAQEFTKYLEDTEKIIGAADAIIRAESVVEAMTTALKTPETAGQATKEVLEWAAQMRGIPVSEMLKESGHVPAPMGDVQTPEFLEESNHETFIAEVLKDAEFQEGAGLEDAKLGAQMVLKALIARIPELLPADYHGEFQDFRKTKEQQKAQDEAKAEAARIVKGHYNAVKQRVARTYEGYTLQEDQLREAVEAFPMPVKDENDSYNAVVLHLQKKLVGFVRKTGEKREKKRMHVTPGGGEHKPQVRENKVIGRRGMSAREALG